MSPNRHDYTHKSRHMHIHTKANSSKENCCMCTSTYNIIIGITDEGTYVAEGYQNVCDMLV